MTTKLFNFRCEEKLIKEIDTLVKKSNSKYKDRTQFTILAIKEKLSKEQ